VALGDRVAGGGAVGGVGVIDEPVGAAEGVAVGGVVMGAKGDVGGDEAGAVVAGVGGVG